MYPVLLLLGRSLLNLLSGRTTPIVALDALQQLLGLVAGLVRNIWQGLLLVHVWVGDSWLLIWLLYLWLLMLLCGDGVFARVQGRKAYLTRCILNLARLLIADYHRRWLIISHSLAVLTLAARLEKSPFRLQQFLFSSYLCKPCLYHFLCRVCTWCVNSHSIPDHTIIGGRVLRDAHFRELLNEFLLINDVTFSWQVLLPLSSTVRVYNNFACRWIWMILRIILIYVVGRSEPIDQFIYVYNIVFRLDSNSCFNNYMASWGCILLLIRTCRLVNNDLLSRNILLFCLCKDSILLLCIHNHPQRFSSFDLCRQVVILLLVFHTGWCDYRWLLGRVRLYLATCRQFLVHLFQLIRLLLLQ